MRRWRSVPTIVASAVLAMAGIAGASGAPAASATTGATVAASDSPGYAYLALGDSYTIGEGVPAEGRWPMQLAAALGAEGVAIDAPTIIAATGWSTAELSTHVDDAAPPGSNALVTLLVGVNDQYRGHPLHVYRDGFTAMLQRAIGLVDGRPDRVLVLSIPDWGLTPFGAASGRDPFVIARELDDYNAAARAICERAGVVFIDITAVSRAHGAEAAMLVDDGLHPSPAMYALWTQAALPAARAALAAP